MTRMAVFVLTLALILSALIVRLVPRYEIRDASPLLIRVDRWTGHAELANYNRPASWLHIRKTAEEALHDVREPAK